MQGIPKEKVLQRVSQGCAHRRMDQGPGLRLKPPEHLHAEAAGSLSPRSPRCWWSWSAVGGVPPASPRDTVTPAYFLF